MHRGPGAALLAVLTLPLAARAQTDSAQARDTARLDPVVTVLRTTLPLSRVPYAIGVAHREAIQRGKPGFALDEALAGIAGVQVDNRFNYALGERLVVRGSGARAQFGVRGVRVLMDGIPLTLADGQTTLNNVDVSSVARAEVVRGPASAQHGNAAGGVVQLETDHASDVVEGRVDGDARAVVGDDGLRRYQASLRVQPGPWLVAIAGSRLAFDGYRDWNDAENDHANVQLARRHAGGRVALLWNWVSYDARNPGALPADSARLKPTMAWPANRNTFRTGETGTQGQGGLTLDQRLGGLQLRLAGHALQRRVDNPIPQRIVVVDRGAGGARVSLTAEPRVGDGVATLVAGAEWQEQSDTRENYVNAGGARGALTLAQLEEVRNTALFTQAHVDLLTSLMVMAGARYDRIRFTATDRLIAPGNPDDSGERTMDAVSPSVGVTWRAGPRFDVYGNFATSFETPTTSELANQPSGAGGFNPSLAPQRTRSVELGVNGRASWAGTAGSWQLAAYEARVNDALIPFEVPGSPGRQYFRNAGTLRNRGVEAGTSLVLPARLAVRASLTHVDSRFVRFAVTSGGVTQTYDGNRVPGVAHNRADLTLSSQPGRIFLDLDTRTSSSMPVNDANSARSDAYTIVAVRAGLLGIRAGAAELAPHVGILNLFDRPYTTSVVVNAFGGRYYEPGQPRSFYGGLTARF